MTRIVLRSSLLALTGLMMAGGALAGNVMIAQAGKGAAKASFESLDKNGDGKVSLNEAAEHDGVFVAFKKLDTNKDGLLTREEFVAYERENPGA
jgi:Ca2+-binding EF-hand superfamily protein